MRLRFFASLREALGDADERSVGKGTTAGALWAAVLREHPKLARVRVRFAVDERYVSADHVLAEGDELAVFPPVSGGS